MPQHQGFIYTLEPHSLSLLSHAGSQESCKNIEHTITRSTAGWQYAVAAGGGGGGDGGGGCAFSMSGDGGGDEEHRGVAVCRTTPHTSL